MNAHRVYVDTELSSEREYDLSSEASHHLLRVLRARVGDPLVLFNGTGGEYAARVTACSKKGITVRTGEKSTPPRESPLAITLVQSLSTGDRMDYTIQKAVELGVARIVPLVTKRTSVQLKEDRHEKRLIHWRGVIRGACEQSGRTHLPDLLPLHSLERWLGRPAPDCGLVCVPEGRFSLSQVTPPPGSVTVISGPEGGLDEVEIALARHAGYQDIRLGPRVLRTETAPVAVLTALQLLWGDLNL